MKKLLFIIVIFILLCSVFIGKGLHYGEEISQIENKISKLKSENNFLKSQIAGKYSFYKISNRTNENILSVILSTNQKDEIALKR